MFWPMSENTGVFALHFTFSKALIFTNSRIVVPFELQTEMLTPIHESYFGIEKCKVCARELLYWPCVSHDIESLVGACNVCSKFQNEHQREPLISHEILNAHFFKVSVDIMTFKNVDYLVVVDYFSKFPKMIVLTDKTMKTVVEHLKCVFA